MGFYFDTVVTLTAYCEQSVLDGALLECARYDALLSKTIEGSDVWRVNHAGAGRPTRVGEDMLAILALAQDVAAQSGGALDVSIGPASALWDFSGTGAALPDASALAAAAALVDYTRLRIEGDSVTLPAGMQLDLGAVAKGYIADRLAAYLQGRGVESGLINLGGNVAALGAKPGGEAWVVGIQNPQSDAGESIAAVAVCGQSVVTSGIYQRGFDLGGVRYHHILDTATGWPVQNGLAGVTIVAPSSALADALSTACFALGIQKGMALAQRYGAEAMFIDAQGQITYTPGMRALLYGQ